MHARRSVVAAIGVGIMALVCAGAYYLFMPRSSVPSGGQPVLPTQTITVGGLNITAEIAQNDNERQLGLSERASLAENSGMLFVFPSDGNWGIWMPGMKFSIDILWADAAGRIVALDAGVSPATYPNIFYPNAAARYALELPAGFAAAHDITVGSRMSLPKL